MNRARIQMVEPYPVHFQLRRSCLDSNLHDTLSVSLATPNLPARMLLPERSNVDASTRCFVELCQKVSDILWDSGFQNLDATF